MGDGSSTDRGTAETDGPSEGGTFACGETFCHEPEICLYPGCGCALDTEPVTDAGLCPDGTTFEDAFDGCVVTQPYCGPPSCVSPDPDSCNYWGCSGENGSIVGTFCEPLPRGSSHVCYGHAREGGTL